MPQDTEFYFSIIILGGIILAGSVLVFGLWLVAMGFYNRVTRKKITKELYEQKNENGQHKGGSRGKW